MVQADHQVSIVIPVYNDPEGLQTTIQSLLSQSATAYEIIIADNGSTDRTSRVAATFAEQKNVVHTIENNIQGSYAARNAGIKAASGEIIGFMDADMWVDSDYISSVRSAMSDGRMYMGGEVKIVADDSPTARYNAATGFPVRDYIQNEQFAPTCCLVVRSELFEAVGTFDQRLISGGDKEFGHRVAKAGYDLKFDSSVVLYHPARETIQSLVSKHVRIGQGMEQRRHYYPDRFGLPHLFHPVNIHPGRPHKFIRRLQLSPASKIELLYWYCIHWLLSVSRSAGRVREAYAQMST